MKRKLFAILIALMWLALPLTALRYALLWDQLPARMATHFAANGRANGWMARETALYFGLGLTAFVLIIFTTVALIILKQKADLDKSSFGLLGIFCFMTGFMFYVNNSIIEHNLTGNAVTVAPFMFGVPAAIVLCIVIYMRAQRGKPLPTSRILAEETHDAKGFSILFLVLGAIEFGIAMSIRVPAVRVAMSFLGVLIPADRGACLGRFSLPLHACRARDPHARPAAALHSAVADCEISPGEVDDAARLWHSRRRQHARLRLGQ